MNKRILFFMSSVLVLFLVGFFIHNYVVDSHQLEHRFSVLSIYGFHAIATITIYLLVESVFKFLPNETGYLYLALSMIKIGLFIMIFKTDVFEGKGLVVSEKGILVIPLVLFLVLEAVGVANLLNKANFSKD